QGDEQEERERGAQEGAGRPVGTEGPSGELEGEWPEEEQQERDQTRDDEEAGHGPPGPADRQRRPDERRARGSPGAPAHPVPAAPSGLLRDDARDDRQSRGVVDSGEEAQRTEGEREERNRRARRDAYHGNRDPRRAQEQQAARWSPVREESERDRPQAIGAESHGRQQAQRHLIRAELQLPGEKENGDRQDVRVDHAMEESEDGHDAPILPPHPGPHRPSGIRTSAVTRGEPSGPLPESRGPGSRRSRRGAKAREGETHDEMSEGAVWSFGYRSARAEPVPRNDYPVKSKAGPGRVHDSSSFASSSSVPDCDSASSSSTAFLTIFLWISGWCVIALRMTRRGVAAVRGTPAGVAGAAPGAACELEGASGGAAARTGWRAA